MNYIRPTSIFGLTGLSSIFGISGGILWQVAEYTGQYRYEIGGTVYYKSFKDIFNIFASYSFKHQFNIIITGLIMSITGFQLYKQISYDCEQIDNKHYLLSKFDDNIRPLQFTYNLKKDYFWMTLKVLLGLLFGRVIGEGISFHYYYFGRLL